MTLDDKLSMAMGTDSTPIRDKYFQKLPADEAVFIGIIDHLLVQQRGHLYGKELEEWQASGGWIKLAYLMRYNLYGGEHEAYVKMIKKLQKKSLIICKENIVNPDMPLIKLNTIRVWEDLLDG